MTRLAQLVGAARWEAEEVTFARLEPLLSPPRRNFLDSLLEVTEHTTDTAGYTELIFALFASTCWV
jgi:hypothetical protein